MASIFDTAVDRDQQNADQLLELVKWASGLRGMQQLGRSYSGPIADAYSKTLGSPAFAPGGPVQGATQNLPPIGPLAIARGAGALPGVLRAGGTGLGRTKGAGMFGADVFDQLIAKINRTGGSIAKKAQDAGDVQQTGQAAAARLIQHKGATGPEALARARSEMKHFTPQGSRGTGVDVTAQRLLEKAEAKLGPVGSDQLLAEVRRMNPAHTQGWTTDTIQHIRGGVRPPALSLDDIAGEGATTIGEGLAGMDRTDTMASIREQISKLSPAMQAHVQKLVTGEIDASQLNPKTLASLRQQMKGGKPISGKQVRPISGGAVGPDDLHAEFPSHAFRDVLSRQPRTQFGQEGMKVTHPGQPKLARTIADVERLLAETGGGNRPAAGAIPESEHYTLGAGRLAEDWDKMRAMFNNVAKFQGRN